MSATQAPNSELINKCEDFLRRYYGSDGIADESILEYARTYQNEDSCLTIDWADVYKFDPGLADDLVEHPSSVRESMQEALRQYDLPVDMGSWSPTIEYVGL